MNEFETRVAEALATFGWTCGPEFWKRYYEDAWVFNLANAVEALSRGREAPFPRQSEDDSVKVSYTRASSENAANRWFTQGYGRELSPEEVRAMLDRPAVSLPHEESQ